MPDTTLDLAIREAYATAPEQIIHQTIELWHPAFTAPVRVVRGHVPLTATLEATAPRHAGEAVLFVALRFDPVPPEVSTTADPVLTLEMDNVGRALTAAIERTVGNLDPITVIYRAYMADDLTRPANNPPQELTVQSINVTPFRVRLVAGYGNMANQRFPSQDYTAERFPSLIGS